LSSVPSQQAAVELEGVTKRFGSAIAVDHLTLRVEAHELLALLGPSGCGKTTTLRMLAGFDDPDSGQIRIDGRDVTGVPPYRRNVNTVFQHYALFPHMTVGENVAYGLRQKGVDRAERRVRVGEALETVRMSSLVDRYPQHLSGGQQQRVALARALINRPSVLLLDEPLGALDRKLRQDMQVELKLLQRQLGTTFIFVTHDQEEALSLANRVAIMVDGKLQQVGSPDDVYDRPASVFVAGFVGQQNFLTGIAGTNPSEVVGEGWVARGARRVGDPPIGARVLVAVRPECVEVTGSPPRESVNSLPGTLAGVLHLGDSLQFVIRTANHQEILATRPRVERPDFEPGSQVWCTWSEEHAQIFTR
jgi:spermidine/putrescine transport system ATP-binding protein